MPKTIKPNILALSITSLIAVVIMGCQPSWTDKIGSDMDRVARGYEKFGTVSISSPILIEAKSEPNNGDYFDFNLPTDANDYYKDAIAKVQGQSAVFEQMAETSRFGLKVQADMTALMGYAQQLADYEVQRVYLSQAAELKAQKVIAALPKDASAADVKAAAVNAAEIRAEATKGMPSPPTPPPCNVPPIEGIPQDANMAKNGLIGSGFTPALGLLDKSGTMLSISNRSAITTAAGDTTTEGIFRLLGNPAKAMQFQDKVIMFGVSMVTVNPGWLTRKNYTAEIAVSCEYDYQPARRELLLQLLEREKKLELNERDEKLIKLINMAISETLIDKSEVNIAQRFQKEFRNGYSPVTAAVSPMTDVDTLDLSNSQRLQTSDALRIAAVLSAAGGATAQADFFKEWAKRKEQDMHTRTAFAAVTAFSNGGYFGFRIRPRFKAIEDPALFCSKAANVLDDQAFPAVVIIGIDRDDLQLSFGVEHDPNNKKLVRIVAFEPLIHFRQTANWLPNKSTWFLGAERLSEAERLRWADCTMKAREKLKSVQIKDNDVVDFAENRITLLEYVTQDSWNAQYIPIDVILNKKDKKNSVTGETALK
jgi:hypothetical protein